MSVANDLQVAIRYHQAGNAAEAEKRYRRILKNDPNQADALHLLGNLLGRKREFKSAMELLRRAISLQPAAAAYYNTLGNIYKDAGRVPDALAAYAQSLRLNPNSAPAHANRGVLFLASARFAEAANSLKSALDLMRRAAPTGDPDQLQIANAYGVALTNIGLHEKAILEFEAVLRHAPRFAPAWANLASALSEIGRFDDAVGACEQATSIDPAQSPAWNNWGIICEKLGRDDEAIRLYHRGTQANPNDAALRVNCARALLATGEADAALTEVELALKLSPQTPEAHLVRASILRDTGKLDESIAAYDRAVDLAPANHSAHSGRIFAKHFHAVSDAAALAEDQRLWDQRHGRPLLQNRVIANDRNPDRQLRVGYISPNFTQHVLALLMLPLFEHHDRAAIEPIFYSDAPRESAVTERFKRCASAWKPIFGMADEKVADLIREDRIDILVDLTMHMQDNRLRVFAMKPAPVQVTWCYPGSTGLAAIDYRITDPYLDPVDTDERLSSEKTYRLPETFFCINPLDEDSQVSPPPFDGNGFITFGSLNNFCKTNQAVFDSWAQVLKQVPNSRLILLSPRGKHRHGVEAIFESHGVSAERIQHVGRMSRSDYLNCYNRIDIALDTFPYNGHTTSLDAFWMGVPVVTLVGRTVVGRAGLGESSNLGLPELAAYTLDQYVSLAVGLAGDPARLRTLRASLRERMIHSPLMQGERFARHFEQAYRIMWTAWCERTY